MADKKDPPEGADASVQDPDTKLQDEEDPLRAQLAALETNCCCGA
jgi:hypothetical protein